MAGHVSRIGAYGDRKMLIAGSGIKAEGSRACIGGCVWRISDQSAVIFYASRPLSGFNEGMLHANLRRF